MQPPKKSSLKARARRPSIEGSEALREAEQDEKTPRSRLVSFFPSNTPFVFPLFSLNKTFFTAALNPTYTFGKRADSGGNASTTVSGWTKADATSSSPVDIAAAKAAGGASIPPLSSPPLGATPPKKVYDHHGHKGNLIFNPLPEIFTADSSKAKE